MIIKKNLFFLIVLSAFYTSYSATSDFVIIESPKSFTIYNQYEQALSASEISELPAYLPFKIVKTDTKLGDQITRVMQCSLGQKIYYILEDDNGAITGNKDMLQVVKGCIILDDTVEILQDGAALSQRETLSSSVKKLSKGNVIVLLFRYKNSFYAMQPILKPQYGWLPSSARNAFKHVSKTNTPDTLLTDQTKKLLIEHIEYANAQYKILFDAFNKSSGMQKSIPEWQRVEDLTWQLSEPYSHNAELDGSAGYLTDELREMLIGKQFAIQYENGRITITPKALR
jgi:hypothetical protein